MTTLRVSHPRLRSDLDLIADGPRRVFFVGDQLTFFVESPVIGSLARLLDGTRNLVELIRALAPSADVASVLADLARLEQFGALVNGEGQYPPDEQALRDALGASGSP